MNILIIIIIIILIITLLIYNRLIKLRNKIKQSESGIDIYLNQRFDLIPNLVECVKGYAKHEKEVLQNTVSLRNEYNKNRNIDLKQASKINGNINKILAIAEGYPQLSANEQYINLQKNLEKMESQLQAARRIYNNDVTIYNTKLETIPINIIGKMLGFRKAELLQIEEYKRENINLESEM
ncbi:MAG: LemA family protein [Clostridia bacterium]|nr:LemA family protein [Clostridia bacterium]